MEEELASLKPDIIVIGAFWYQYNNVEWLSETLRFLHWIGVRRIIVVGTTPLWPEPPQSLLYKTVRLDPSRRIPDRLSTFHPDSFKFDEELKTIAANLGASFISMHDIFCNELGCLVRSGNSARDILQVDLTHFSAAGSWYLISRVADEIFNGFPTSKLDDRRAQSR